MFSRLAHASRNIFVAQVVTNVLTMGLTWLLLRSATPEDVSLIPMTTLVGGALNVVLMLGSGTMLMRYLPKIAEHADGSNDEPERALGFTVRMLALGAVLTLASTPLVWAYLGNGAMRGFPASDIYVVIAAGVVVASGLVGSYFIQSTRRYKALAGANVASAAIQGIGCVVLHLAIGRAGIPVGVALASVPYLFEGARSVVRLPVRWGHVVEHAKRPTAGIAAEGRTYMLHSPIRYVAINSDVIVITAMLGARDLALYWVAYKLINYIFMIAQAVFKPAVTEIAAIYSDTEMRRELLTSLRDASIMVFAPISVGVAAIAPWFLKFYGGAGYSAGVITMVILAMYSFAYVMYSTRQSGVMAGGDPKALLVLEIVACVAGVGFTAAFASVAGLQGVALGQLVGMVTSYWVAGRLAPDTKAIGHAWAVTFKALGLSALLFAGAALPYFRDNLFAAPVLCAIAFCVYTFAQLQGGPEAPRTAFAQVLPAFVRDNVGGVAR